MYNDIIAEKKEAFVAAYEHLLAEYKKLRTGRANPQLVEGLMIDVYGVQTPLKQVANISVPEARQILIQPWDKSHLESIAAAITKADIGVTPANDGLAIRLTLPPMTEENRTDLVKVLNQKTEEARVRVRSVREDAWKDILAAEKEKMITEDDKFAGKDALQVVVDEYNERIEEARKKKEEEIMTV